MPPKTLKLALETKDTSRDPYLDGRAVELVFTLISPDRRALLLSRIQCLYLGGLTRQAPP